MKSTAEPAFIRSACARALVVSLCALAALAGAGGALFAVESAAGSTDRRADGSRPRAARALVAPRDGRRLEAGARARLHRRSRSTRRARPASSRSSRTSGQRRRARPSRRARASSSTARATSSPHAHVVVSTVGLRRRCRRLRERLRRSSATATACRPDRRLGSRTTTSASSASPRRRTALAPVPLGSSSTRRRRASRWRRSARPFGDAASLSVGVVSGTGRTIPSLTTGYNLVRRDPDRRADQPGQLGRAAPRRAGPRDRHQRTDPLEPRVRLRGRRASRSRSTRPSARSTSSLGRARSPTPTLGVRPRTSRPASRRSSASRRRTGAIVDRWRARRARRRGRPPRRHRTVVFNGQRAHARRRRDRRDRRHARCAAPTTSRGSSPSGRAGRGRLVHGPPRRQDGSRARHARRAPGPYAVGALAA